MKITITLHCPHCQSAKIKKNGKKTCKKQNYFCNACGRQFIGDHALTYYQRFFPLPNSKLFFVAPQKKI